MDIVVKVSPGTHHAKLQFMGKTYDCVIGKTGFLPVLEKKESDGATPLGRFALRRVFYRQDKISLPDLKIPVQVISEQDGWCDAPAHPDYNRLVKKPFDASHEDMWRDDDLYNIVVEIGYNDAPVVPGKGSAIFMHVCRPAKTPTLGCVALPQEELTEVLQNCTAQTQITIKE